MFVCLPGIRSPEWPEDVLQVFQKNYASKRVANPCTDFIYFRINGCTFSGDPYTTVRNTMASDCYGHYYAYKERPALIPWEMHDRFQVEAGDDLVLWGPQRLSEIVLQYTSRTKDGMVGLG